MTLFIFSKLTIREAQRRHILLVALLMGLVYLALFGSVIAFGCYLTLVGRIGPGRAAYVTLLFPVVALMLSTIWEDYHWTLSGLSGILLILCGNYLALAKQRVLPSFLIKTCAQGSDEV